ncbi:MAG: GIY-YIG nuclease family protein [Phycisphaerae bacterium]|nr:GIY-YIG nuclease family protein [Phycisphaerae bacterium]NIP56345.1 GIY-YIG nuclease family protein [Phycisphaerae bacterium]NIS54761.1 GIY-YIG nuclease family protein [Phycisphaerae bacterium]NIU12356.1 GIY-YIG nuclease family protein [Phycisphaerae bacterium]NIU60255.1 GIY-YIG nuclease family protein [Phycisphaerae bacterium]
MWYTYILKCADNSYYTGHTNDLSERLSRHNAGLGPKWTACRLPVQLAYKESHENQESAINHEKQIKKWSGAKKDALIEGNAEKLKRLSKRHRT